jgi:xanthine dehydrogenase accessory factor
MTSGAFWASVDEWLGNGQEVVLLVVALSEKGSPGTAGAMMAVTLKDSSLKDTPTETTETVGTIGGGIMETRLLAEAASHLSRGQELSFCRKLHHHKHAADARSVVYSVPSGLICSGSQTIVCVTLRSEHCVFVAAIMDAIHANAPVAMRLAEQAFVLLPDSGFPERRIFVDAAKGQGWSYTEVLGQRETAYILGGGHVGRALARQLRLLDFYVVVVDDRENLARAADHQFAHQFVIAPFTTLDQIVKEGELSYAVVVSTAYTSDVEALKNLAGKHLAYLGLMGSAAKIRTIFAELRACGISEDALVCIHAPAGVQVNSDTPEEIAVSIAAEMIGVKNTRLTDV